MDSYAVCTRVLPWVALFLVSMALVSMKSDPVVAYALFAWGTATYFGSRALAGLTGAIERSSVARVLLGLGLILLLGGAGATSAQASIHTFGNNGPTGSLLGWIGAICFVLGSGSVILGFLMPRPADWKDDYGGLLPAKQATDEEQIT